MLLVELVYGESDFGYLCLVGGYCWYYNDIICVSNHKIDVVLFGVVCVGDPVIGLCMYSCGVVESERDVDELFDVYVFDDCGDVEVITGWLLHHNDSCGVVGAVLWYCKN